MKQKTSRTEKLREEFKKYTARLAEIVDTLALENERLNEEVARLKSAFKDTRKDLDVR